MQDCLLATFMFMGHLPYFSIFDPCHIFRAENEQMPDFCGLEKAILMPDPLGKPTGQCAIVDTHLALTEAEFELQMQG